MNSITLLIEQVIKEVYVEYDFLSDHDLAFFFLDGLRRASLKDLKSDFKSAAKDAVYNRTRNIKPKEPVLSGRLVSEDYTRKLMHKTAELLIQKSMNEKDDKTGYGEFIYDGYPFIEAGYFDFAEFLVEENTGKNIVVSGRITSVRIRSSGKKKFAYLTLIDHNKKKLTVLVSSTFYAEYELDLKNCKGNYVGASGKLAFSNYLKSLILKAYELEFPKGYFIERIPVLTN